MSKIEESQQSSVRPYKEWDGSAPEKPQFGILSKLNGTWVNWKGGPTGLHTTPMPSPGTSSETIFGVFTFKSQEYREQLKFIQVNEPVRNRAGSNEQFCGAVKYETAIVDNDNNLQHFENGMYLWLGDNQMPWDPNSPFQNPPTMFRNPSTSESVTIDGAEPVLGPGQIGPQFVPPHSISRSGVIPHGTTIHLMGSITQKDIEGKAPHIANLWEHQYLSVSKTMGISFEGPDPDLHHGTRDKPGWTMLSREEQKPNAGPSSRGVNSGRAYIEKIFNYDSFGAKFPYTVQPNLKLIDANEGLSFRKYNLIELDSRQDTGIQGATVNNAMIDRYCKVTRFRVRIWLEEIHDEESGRVIDQLQYEQIVDFEFMFGADGNTTQWPHIQVNTLRRERDIPPEKRFPSIQLHTEPAEEAQGGPEPIVYRMKHTR
jgi:hypothetical protein